MSPNLKVDPNDRTFGSFGGMPIRLEIATRLFAAAISNPNEGFSFGYGQALSAADELIKAHNETCEPKEMPLGKQD